MCGIVGIIASYGNGFTMDEGKAFRDMVVVDSLRGFDSTGVFSVANNGNVQMHKDAVTGSTFVTTTEYNKFNTDVIANGMFAVGHNRAATRGTVNDKNAHPFCIEDNIILVQNGTYRGSHTHHKDTEVDTEAIAWVLHEHPNDIQTALQKINAAYCLVWYNVTDKALYIIRNKERPMFIAYNKQGGIMFASEPETIMLAASRNNIKLNKPPYLIAEDTLFKWQLDTDKKTYSFSDVKLECDFRGTPHYAHWYNNPAVWDQEITERANIHPIVRQVNTTDKGQDITIHSYVYDGRFDNSMVTDAQATAIRENIMARNRDSEMLVEFVDYLPAKTNFNKECRTWYVIGTPIVGDDTAPLPVVYSMIFDKSEIDIYTMLDVNGFYSVRVPGTPIEHVVKDNRGVNGRIVTLFCSNMKEVVHAEVLQ
jgi:glucosamine 6-phosphate synthetase-like amidotransferase/phosphosugar isomerase protein